nr:hypothetical protein [Alphaproteobacteria bacterium]
MDRRLAAVMAADVVGYSSLMEQDEDGTLDTLQTYRRDFIDPAIAMHNGRIVKLMGDGALVEFASVVDAVESAIAIQTALAENTDGKLKLRIGINLGDIIIDGDDIYGEGVNVAARLETIAPAGGICISSIVHDSLGNRIDENFSDAGEYTVKNIERSIRVYRWPAGEDSQPSVSAPALPDKPSIVVLPFDNLTNDPEQEYFADGMVE